MHPQKILATRMRKGPRLTLVWAPEWLIRPCQWLGKIRTETRVAVMTRGL